MTITSGFQLIVSPILIFGLFGVPAQGLLGSAYAFLIIGFIRIIAFGVLVANEDILQTTDVLKGWLQSAKGIMHIALPSMLSSLIGPISMGITIALLAAHGDVIVAAFGVVSRIEMLVTMILGALASSVAPFVGQNWGAKQDDRVSEGLSIGYRFCFVLGSAVFHCFGALRRQPGRPDQRRRTTNRSRRLVPDYCPDQLWIDGRCARLLHPSSLRWVNLCRRQFCPYSEPLSYISPMAIVFDMYWGYIGIFCFFDGCERPVRWCSPMSGAGLC